MDKRKSINIYLETGQLFKGEIFTKTSIEMITSEIVFNTSMTGYQEILTDPSYSGQSLIMTYPLIGNYGISPNCNESNQIHMDSLIINEYCEQPSHWNNKLCLKNFLENHNTLGIHQVDTRALVKRIRDFGSMKVVITPDEISSDKREQLFQSLSNENHVEKVSIKDKSIYNKDAKDLIVMLDFGHKKSIRDIILKNNFQLIIVPWNTHFKEIVKLNPRGIILSNGPGDPKSIINQVKENIKKLQERFPMLCICMGHQIFALTNGADTEKMRFGNRGSNHPVYNIHEKKTYITAQNHSYTVNKGSLKNTDLEVLEYNLNDQSIEALTHRLDSVISVQYHPEACAGPKDTMNKFYDFFNLIKRGTHAEK